MREHHELDVRMREHASARARAHARARSQKPIVLAQQALVDRRKHNETTTGPSPTTEELCEEAVCVLCGPAAGC